MKKIKNFISENFKQSEYPEIVKEIFSDGSIESLEGLLEYDDILLNEIEEVESFKTSLFELRDNLIPQLMSDTNDKDKWIDKFINTVKFAIAIGKLGEKITEEIENKLPEYIKNLSL